MVSIGGAGESLSPAGASFGSWRASAALNEPLRRLPHMTMTLSAPSAISPAPFLSVGGLFAGQLAHVLLEARELLLDEIDGRLVLQFELVVELGLRHADE